MQTTHLLRRDRPIPSRRYDEFFTKITLSENPDHRDAGGPVAVLLLFARRFKGRECKYRGLYEDETMLYDDGGGIISAAEQANNAPFRVGEAVFCTVHAQPSFWSTNFKTRGSFKRISEYQLSPVFEKSHEGAQGKLI
jgi:hypothetical protein